MEATLSPYPRFPSRSARPRGSWSHVKFCERHLGRYDEQGGRHAEEVEPSADEVMPIPPWPRRPPPWSGR